MRTLSITGGSLAAMTVVALVAACNDPASMLPSSPSAPSASIEIDGPASIAPGQPAQFIAFVRLSDGTSKSVTTTTWASSNPFAMRVHASSGLATAFQKGETTLSATVTIDGGVRRATREVTILPDGTFRLVGVVTEADSPARIGGARVEVTSGTPLATTTDANGEYRLYGVAPDAELRVNMDGYLPLVQRLQLSGHTTQNFQLTLSATRLNLAGSYTLTIDVLDGCPGSSPLPADLLHRQYEVVLTQDGPAVEVALSESTFRVNSIGRGNRFSGRADGAGATFNLDGWGDPFYYRSPTDYPQVVERLSNGTFLVVSGRAVTTGSAAGVSGLMNGGLQQWNSRFPTGQVLGSCALSAARFTLTPR